MLKRDNQTLVLEEFFKTRKEGEGLRLRELGREIGLAPMSVKKYLEELEREGIIKKEKKEGYPQYYPNTNNKQYKYLKNLHIIRKIHESGIIEHIEKTARPEIIVMTGINFGHEEGEIKLYLRGKAENIRLEEYEQKINKKIVIIPIKEIKNLTEEEKEEIMNGIVIKGRISLKEKEFVKPIEEIGEKILIDEGKEEFYSRTF